MSQDNPRTAINRFFSNPIVGMIGTLASVIGVLLAIYFYLDSLRSRELAFTVRPTKTIVVKAGQTSQLSVLFQNKRLEEDVTAIQIDFWNNGKEPIRREHVLRNFLIEIPKTEIIETRLLRESREVTEIRLDKTLIAKGKLGVSWNILEHNDGGVIQIVFTGKSDSPVLATAVIEGQPKLLRISSSEKRSRNDNFFILISFTLLAASMVTLFSFSSYEYLPSSLKIILYILRITSPLVIAAYILMLYLIFTTTSSPFGS